MEKTLLNYLLEASMALAVLYAVYELLLKRSLHFRFNRFFILAALVLAAVLPWVELPVQQTMMPALPGFALAEATISTGSQADASIWSHLTSGQVLTWLYGMGAAVMLIRLLLQLLNLWRWRHKLPAEEKSGYQLILTNGALPTFSFFRWLFWDNSQPLTEAEETLILAHEQTHMRQWHSADVLVLEVGKILFWFHPAVYAFQKAQRAVHEYLADEAAIRHSSPDIYLKLLTHSLLQKFNLQLVQSFYQSPLKNRMKMLQLSQTAKPTVWKAVASITLVALVITFYACRSQDGIIPSKTATTVDQMPMYEGGIEAFNMQIQQEIRYPASARNDAVQGEVLAAYTVTKNGTIENIEIIKGIREDLDEEVKRVIATLNKSWTPGRKGSKAVDVRMTFPVNFMIDGIKSKGTASKDAVVVVGYSAPPPPHAFVGQMPEFPGGTEGLIKYLTENLKYPKEAREKGIYGKVFVSFIVDHDGTLRDIDISQGVSADIDAEALRVVKAMPKWIPAKDKGQEVDVSMVLPIAFSLGK
jgi:TonB family protein